MNAVETLGGVAERTSIVVPSRGIAWVDKSPKVVAGELGQPSARRVTFCAPMVQVSISDHRAVVVRPPHHDLGTTPTCLPAPKIRAVKSIHAGLDVVPLVRRVIHAPVRRHPKVDSAIRPREEFDIVHVGVRVSVRRKLPSPCDPVGIE